jgi:hypothetical protein
MWHFATTNGRKPLKELPMRPKKRPLPLTVRGDESPLLGWEESYITFCGTAGTGKAYLSYVRVFLEVWQQSPLGQPIEEITADDLNAFLVRQEKKTSYRTAFQSAWAKFSEFMRVVYAREVVAFQVFLPSSVTSFPADALLLLSQFVRLKLLYNAVWNEFEQKPSGEVVFSRSGYPRYTVPASVVSTTLDPLLRWGYGGNKVIWSTPCALLPAETNSAQVMSQNVVHRLLAGYTRKLHADLPAVTKQYDLKMLAQFVIMAAENDDRFNMFLEILTEEMENRHTLWLDGVRGNPVREAEAVSAYRVEQMEKDAPNYSLPPADLSE